MEQPISTENLNLEDLFNDEINNLITDVESEVDIVAFCESPHFLNQKLHSAERFVLKVYYGLPLNNINKDILVRSFPHDEKGILMSELEYARFLQLQDRTNMTNIHNEFSSMYLLLACGRRSGKCESENSYIFSNQGTLQLKELAGDESEDQYSEIDISVVQEKGEQVKADKFYNGGIKPVRKITTHRGYTLSATYPHRIKVIFKNGNIEWKEFKDITIGEKVCINRKNDIWPKQHFKIHYPYEVKKRDKLIRLPKCLNKQYAELLGFLVADGTWKINNCVQITIGHQNPDLIEYITSIYRNLFPEFKLIKQDDNGNVRITFYSTEYRKFLDYLGFRNLCGQSGTKKKIPWIIFRERKPIVASFLSALIDSDGNVEGNKHLSYCSESKELIFQLQLLLLNFGIVSSRYSKFNKKYKKHFYYLYIGGYRNLILFEKEIGFISQYHKDQLRQTIERLNPDYNGNDNQDKIPYQQERMSEFWEEHPTTRQNRHLIRHVAYGQYDLSYSKLNKLVEEFEVQDHYFNHLQDLDYFFDEVIEIEEREEQVYDLHVPSNHMYVSNGFMSHNTFLASVISSYEAYKLIVKGNPQKYYGLTEGEHINVLNVATNAEQAIVLSEATKQRITNSQWFQPFIASSTKTCMRLRTKQDLEKLKYIREEDKESTYSIILESMSCTARGIRGKTVIVVILDEIAHFITGTSGNMTGAEVFKALVPSISTFNEDGKVLCISSPYNKAGIFYDLYVKSKGSESIAPNENIRMFQIPTWEMNDTINFNYLKTQYDIDPDSFDYEYGAQFSGTISGFFKFPEKIDECVESEWKENVGVRSRHHHYVAIDPAVILHGYALCMVHVETNKNEDGEIEKIVYVDRWKRWTSDEEQFKDIGLIDPTVVDEYIIELSKYFKIIKVVYDQFESASSIHRLNKHGLNAMRQPFSISYNMKIYQRLRQMIYDNKLILPPYLDGLNELRQLQQRKVGVKRFVVQAPPQGLIVTDDLADVLANAVYIATESEITKNVAQVTGRAGSGASISSRGGTGAGLRKNIYNAYRQRLMAKRNMGYRR